MKRTVTFTADEIANILGDLAVHRLGRLGRNNYTGVVWSTIPDSDGRASGQIDVHVYDSLEEARADKK